jgi:membrane-associated phospholipid phosphatase
MRPSDRLLFSPDLLGHLRIKGSIPLIPGAITCMSIYLLFLAGPFIVRDRHKFAALIARSCWRHFDYNMVPPLHVALSVCCIAAFVRRASQPGSTLLWIWAAAIALSTLLTHQHHVVDAISGWSVGIVTDRATPGRG